MAVCPGHPIATKRARHESRAFIQAALFYFTVKGTVAECWRLPDVAVTVTVYADCLTVGAFDAELWIPPHPTEAITAAAIANPSRAFFQRAVPVPISVTPNSGIHIASANP
jgi:hypothetical protein